VNAFLLQWSEDLPSLVHHAVVRGSAFVGSIQDRLGLVQALVAVVSTPVACPENLFLCELVFHHYVSAFSFCSRNRHCGYTSKGYSSFFFLRETVRRTAILSAEVCFCFLVNMNQVFCMVTVNLICRCWLSCSAVDG
jgi:hypothetical protein